MQANLRRPLLLLVALEQVLALAFLLSVFRSGLWNERGVAIGISPTFTNQAQVAAAVYIAAKSSLQA